MSEKVTATKKEPGMAMLIIVLTVISIVMALCLGFVNNATAPAIALNAQKSKEAAMQVVLPHEGTYDLVEYTGTDTAVAGVYQAGDEGYVVETVPTSGFSGAIVMLTGISADGAVTGIAVITHAETSGLGSKAKTDSDWQAQFVGTTEPVSVTKDGGTIESITGSTITSRAICDGVNSARAALAEIG